MSDTSKQDETEYRHVYGGRDPSGPFATLRFPLPRLLTHAELEGSPPNWFLGPRGENMDLFAELVAEAIDSNHTFRQSFKLDDPPIITDATKNTPQYEVGLATLRATFTELLRNLRNDATPFASWRYQGHMLWDTTLPSLLGYFATMLHNPNNVTIQASTLTTFLEEMVGWDLCGMVGFPFPDLEAESSDGDVTPHGHLTSGGTVANIEATWVARELKFLPVAVHGALTETDSPLYWYTDDQKAAITVTTADGREVPILELDQWELLNVRQDSALRLPSHIRDVIGPPDIPGDRAQLRWRSRDVWDLLLGGSVNALGTAGFYAEFLGKEYLTPIGGPVIVGPVTWHYSWPKAMALLGGGTVEPGILPVEVDPIGRMDIDDLVLQLNRAKAARNPVLLVVSVLGSTEESAVDDLDKVLEVREDFRQNGLDFNVHVDAAWGGYFASILRRDYEDPGDHNRHDGGDPFISAAGSPDDDAAHHSGAEYQILMSDHVAQQIRSIRRADSATIDPHKTGYVPYPAGAITYRNGEVRRLITFGAPVIGSSTTALSVGEYGVEGSKPGAAAASVYLSHAVIRPSHCGHGKLMNASLVNTRALYAALLNYNLTEQKFIVAPLVDLRLRDGSAYATDDDGALRPEYQQWLLEEDAPCPAGPIDDLDRAVSDMMTGAHDPAKSTLTPTDLDWLRNVGPDMNIVDYMFNFRLSDGSVNDDLRLLNKFNRAIYEKVHVPSGQILDRALERETQLQDLSVLLSKTEIWRNTYGDDFVFPFLERLGIRTFGPGRDAVVEALQTRDPTERDALEAALDCYRKVIVMRSVVMDPFIHAESPSGFDYATEWVRTLYGIIDPIADEFRKGDPHPELQCGD